MEAEARLGGGADEDGADEDGADVVAPEAVVELKAALEGSALLVGTCRGLKVAAAAREFRPVDEIGPAVAVLELGAEAMFPSAGELGGLREEFYIRTEMQTRSPVWKPLVL
jgi:hypothetical protein